MKRLFNILITLLITSACSTKTTYAPVRDAHQYEGKTPSHHTVMKGDTLYSIAWRYNLDYRRLARANGIDKNYRIFPGQKIKLSFKKQLKTAPVIKKSNQKPPVKKTPAPKPKISRSKKETSKPVKKPLPVAQVKQGKWLWPSKGKVTNTFWSNNGLHKGVDIQGKLGEPVLAAAAGRVVYAGEGLRGYGKLVILKHNEKFLSAYAHNKRLLVKEGDVVNKGNKIAVMGSSGTDRVKLHFQIRYDGKPVDPLKYLPSK